MYWLWVIIIVIVWIVGMTLSLGILYDYKNTGKIGEESLETAIAHVYLALLPAVVFVLTAIVVRIAGKVVTLPMVLVSLAVWVAVFEMILGVKQFRSRKKRAESPGSGTDNSVLHIWIELVPLAVIAAMYGMWFLFFRKRTYFYIALAVLLFVLFVYPVLAIAFRWLWVRLFVSPEKMAEKLHREDREDVSDLPKELARQMGPAFDFGSVEMRKRYLDACLTREQSTVTGLARWEYIEVLDNCVFRSRMDLRCFAEDGECRVVRLDWKRKDFAKERLSEEDREIIRIAEEFSNVTLTGRLGYVLRCFETYLMTVAEEALCRWITEPFWVAASADEWNRDGSGMSVSFPKKIAGVADEDVETMRILFHLIRDLITDHSAWLRLFERGEYVTSRTILQVRDVLRRCGVLMPEAKLPSQFTFARDTQVIKNEGKNAEAWGFGPGVRSLSLLVK